MAAVLLNSSSGADMNLIVKLAKKLKIDVTTISPEDMEEIVDRKLLRSMLEARREGIADRQTVLKKLGL